MYCTLRYVESLQDTQQKERERGIYEKRKIAMYWKVAIKKGEEKEKG